MRKVHAVGLFAVDARDESDNCRDPDDNTCGHELEYAIPNVLLELAL